MRKLIRSLKALASIPGVPFHMELYAMSPERFGAFRPGPMPRASTLTKEQLRGEYWLHVLRLLLLGATVVLGLGLLVVGWNYLTSEPTPVRHPSEPPRLMRPF